MRSPPLQGADAAAGGEDVKWKRGEMDILD